MKKYSNKILLMEKSLVLFLLLLISVCIFGLSVCAETYEVLTYSVTNDVATITGVIDKNAFSGNQTIPEKIGDYVLTEIASSAFKDCNGLTSITVPDSVTSIGEGAFEGCTNIKSMELPSLQSNLGSLFGCTTKTSAHLYNRNDYDGVLIRDLDQKLLIKNEINDLQTYYGTYQNYSYEYDRESSAAAGYIASYYRAKYNFYSIPKTLKSVLIRNGNIPERAFYNCYWINVSISDTTNKIGDYAFSECSDPWDGGITYTLSDTVSSIGKNAFDSSATIQCYSNSYAESYAKENNLKTIIMSDVHEHLYSDWEKEDDTNHKKVCECGDKVIEVHNWNNGIITTPATNTTTGIKTFTCTKCSSTRTEVIEKLQTAGNLTVNSVTGKAGENVKVTLDISNNPGILGMMLKVSYDSELILTAIEGSVNEEGSALGTLDFTPGKDLTANPINVAWDGLDADSTNGRILNMYFTIPEDAENGATYDVQISYEMGNIYDNDYNDVDMSISNGNIVVKNYILGDVSGDGVINMKDVTMLRRGVIGGYGITLDEAADVNCDKITNMKDVTILRRYVVGGYGVTLK